jgi:hypothetical protein
MRRKKVRRTAHNQEPNLLNLLEVAPIPGMIGRMKRTTAICWALGLGAWLASPQDARPEDAPKAAALSVDDRAQYSVLNKAELRLDTEVKLLTELAEEHLKRSTDPVRSGSLEKVRWEADLAQELRGKASSVLGQLNEVTTQRLAFETAHGAAAAGLGALEEGKALNVDELAYVAKLDERLLRVRQELVATAEVAKNLTMQLLTNTTAQAVGRVSVLLGENTLHAAQWAREQSELELRKLEFRALRR